MIRLPNTNPLEGFDLVSMETRGEGRGKFVKHTWQFGRGEWKVLFKWNFMVPFNPAYDDDGKPVFRRSDWILDLMLDQQHSRVRNIYGKDVQWPVAKPEAADAYIHLFNRLDTGLNSDNYTVYQSLPGSSSKTFGQVATYKK